jgi:hypothetical protein
MVDGLNFLLNNHIQSTVRFFKPSNLFMQKTRLWFLNPVTYSKQFVHIMETVSLWFDFDLLYVLNWRIFKYILCIIVAVSVIQPIYVTSFCCLSIFPGYNLTVWMHHEFWYIFEFDNATYIYQLSFTTPDHLSMDYSNSRGNNRFYNCIYSADFINVLPYHAMDLAVLNDQQFFQFIFLTSYWSDPLYLYFPSLLLQLN